MVIIITSIDNNYNDINYIMILIIRIIIVIIVIIIININGCHKPYLIDGVFTNIFTNSKILNERYCGNHVEIYL